MILRPSFVFGPGGGALPQFAAIVALLAGDSGGRPRHAAHPADLVETSPSSVCAGARTLPEGGPYFELGGPDVVTLERALGSGSRRTLGKRRPLVHVPFGSCAAPAAVLERLPKPPVTRDQLTMLERRRQRLRPGGRPRSTFGVELIPLDEQLAGRWPEGVGGPDEIRPYTIDGPARRTGRAG